METDLLALLAGIFGGWELILILAIVLILLGARQLPELGAGLGLGLWEFKKGMKDVTDEIADEMEGKNSYGDKTSGLVYEALTTDNRTAEFVYPHKEDPNLRRVIMLFLAQGFGIGRIPFAPGTFGSIVGVGWFALLVATGSYWSYLAGTLGGLALAVWICGAAERILKQRDPPSVVLDEIAAVPICFLPWVTQAMLGTGTLPPVASFFAGNAVLQTAVIFGLFRLFDIGKPWPVRQSQRLPGGWGVVLDDVLAAVYVLVIVALFLVA